MHYYLAGKSPIHKNNSPKTMPAGDFVIAIKLKNRHNRYNAIIIMWGESAMMESIEFLISLVLCLVYIGVPLTLIGVVLNKLGKGQNRELN